MTAQIHEVLVFDGQIVGMASCPPLPSAPRQMQGLSDQEKEAARAGSWQQLAAAAGVGSAERIVDSSACWRRYRATWEIIDDRLYLMHVDGHFERLGALPLHADWFTGVLVVPSGKRLHYVHMGFESVYERELQFTVEHGRVTGRDTVDNTGRRFDDGERGWWNLPGLAKLRGILGFASKFSGGRDLDKT